MLIKGPSGTGKSTAVRGLSELLPEIDVIADCPFSCSPAEPCALCAERVAQGASFEDAFAPISADLQALFGKLGDVLSGECA